MTKLVGVKFAGVFKKPLASGRFGYLIACLLCEELRVLVDEVVLREPGGHRRVLNRLHVNGVRRTIAFQLGDHQAAFRVEAKDIEAV